MITKALVAILAGVTASLAVPLERQLALPIACANSVACLTFYSAESDLTILGWIPQSDNQAGKCVCSPSCVDSSANPCKSHVKAQIDVPDGKWVKHMGTGACVGPGTVGGTESMWVEVFSEGCGREWSVEVQICNGPGPGCNNCGGSLSVVAGCFPSECPGRDC